MKNLIVLLISVLVAFSLNAETVYKKVNPDGSVEFTDTPAQGSKEIKIRKTMTYQAPKLPSATPSARKKETTADRYEITILTPANDSTVVGSPDVQVGITLKPALRTGEGHRIRYKLTGKEILSESTSVTFKNVYRGTHTISVDVVDKNSSPVSKVATQVFHMKRFHK